MRAGNYVEETTTSIAGASGDGAVTMTQITNTPRFGTVFGTGAVLVRYVIEDTVNKKFETGYGSVASHVLTRTYPSITWDGTTYDDTAPTAIAFGSSPTSGNIKIRMGPTVDTMSATMPGIQTTITTGNDAWSKYPLSASIIKGSNAGAAVTGWSDNVEFYAYYRLERGGRLLGVQYEVTAYGGSTTGLKSALYPVDHNGAPGTKILDFATASFTTTGVKTDDVPSGWSTGAAIYLNPGWYVFGMIHNVINTTFKGYNNAVGNNLCLPTPLGHFGTTYLGYKHNFYKTGSYTTGMPTNPSLTSGIWAHFVWVGLSVVP